jgi:hypothetical protein
MQVESGFAPVPGLTPPFGSALPKVPVQRLADQVPVRFFESVQLPARSSVRS